MSSPPPTLVIKRRPDDVRPFVDTARQRADAERDALGFIPQRAYQDAAIQGKLWIAVRSVAGVESYLGHILFGGAFPNLRIFQLFVDPHHRRRGVASTLLAELIREAESFSYLTITAKVADDLEANAFWNQRGFQIVRSQPGGTTRNRTILLRERRLNTPTLFDLLNTSVTPNDHDLRLVERLYERAPVYAFDLNVLFDLTRNRSRASDVRRIIAAAMANSVRLYVASEFVAELAKTSPPGGQDPVLEFARTLPQFPEPPANERKHLILELAPLVFPERSRSGRLKPKDESDLSHLASVIHHKAAGFVTSEKAILRCRAIFRQNYGLDVVGVPELAESLTPTQWAEHAHRTTAAGDRELNCSELKEHERAEAERFLESFGLDLKLVSDALAPGHSRAPRRRLVISSGADSIVYASWDAPQRLASRIDAFLFACESHIDIESALEYALFLLIQDAARHGPSLVRVCSRPGGPLLRIATAIGFRPTASNTTTSETVLHKICLGGVMHVATWNSVRQQLAQVASVGITGHPPKYSGPNTPLSVTSPQGTSLCLPLLEFEDLIGPALLLLPGRCGAIVPIRRQYAEQLLGTSPQTHLFPKYEASLLSRRAYFSNVRALTALVPGTVLLFYESQKDGGRGAIVACARAVENAITLPHEVSQSTKRRGVLEDEPIRRIGQHGKAGVTFFDTLMKLADPVPLRRLRLLGCADQSNFVTSRRISHEHLNTLLAEGSPYV